MKHTLLTVGGTYISPDSLSGKWNTGIIDGGNFVFATAKGDTEEQSIERASAVVHACNSHNELVEAAKTARTALARHAYQYSLAVHAIELLNVALVKAEGKQ